jgi:hypothetical protein
MLLAVFEGIVTIIGDIFIYAKIANLYSFCILAIFF